MARGRREAPFTPIELGFGKGSDSLNTKEYALGWRVAAPPQPMQPLHVFVFGLSLGTTALLASRAAGRSDLPLLDRLIVIGVYGLAVVMLPQELRDDPTQTDDRR